MKKHYVLFILVLIAVLVAGCGGMEVERTANSVQVTVGPTPTIPPEPQCSQPEVHRTGNVTTVVVTDGTCDSGTLQPDFGPVHVSNRAFRLRQNVQFTRGAEQISLGPGGDASLEQSNGELHWRKLPN